jgi:predicted CoA-binding protein
MDWRANLITSNNDIRALLADVRRVAVLGIRSERYAARPAYYVPAALAAAGLEIVPVPVYEPEVTQILGRPVYRRLVDVPGAIDLVDVFRRSVDIPGHVDDILAKRPRAVWFQSGIRNNEVAERLARAGIKVVQDRCLMVDYRYQRRAA